MRQRRRNLVIMEPSRPDSVGNTSGASTPTIPSIAGLPSLVVELNLSRCSDNSSDDVLYCGSAKANLRNRQDNTEVCGRQECTDIPPATEIFAFSEPPVTVEHDRALEIQCPCFTLAMKKLKCQLTMDAELLHIRLHERL